MLYHLSCVNIADLLQVPYQHYYTISQSPGLLCSPISSLTLNNTRGLMHGCFDGCFFGCCFVFGGVFFFRLWMNFKNKQNKYSSLKYYNPSRRKISQFITSPSSTTWKHFSTFYIEVDELEFNQRIFPSWKVCTHTQKKTGSAFISSSETDFCSGYAFPHLLLNRWKNFPFMKAKSFCHESDKIIMCPKYRHPGGVQFCLHLPVRVYF